MGMVIITYPACKWLTYCLIEAFLVKCKKKRLKKLLKYVYKTWMISLCTRPKLDLKINYLLSYNYNIFMQHDYASLKCKSYTSDTDIKNTENGMFEDEVSSGNNENLKYYFKKNLISSI